MRLPAVRNRLHDEYVREHLPEWLAQLAEEERAISEDAIEVERLGAHLAMLTKRRDVLRDFLEKHGALP